MLDLKDLTGLSVEALRAKGSAWLEQTIQQVLRVHDEEYQANHIAYYRVVNPAAMRVHLSTAREVAVVGGNRTPVAGTRIVTGRGLIRAEEVKVGDEILLMPQRQPRSGRWRQKPRIVHAVTETYNSGSAVPVYRLTTKRGYTITGNSIHPVWVCGSTEPAWHHGTEPDRHGRFVELRCIQPGMFAALKFHGAFPSASEITPDDAYFLGLMTGDGFWAPPAKSANVMTFTSNDKDEVLFEWLRAYLGNHGVRVTRSHKAQRNGTQLSWCNRAFRRLIDSWGVVCAKGAEKSIPDVVWQGTESVVAAFIRGMADTDGCATTKPSVVIVGIAESLMRGLHLLLLRWGIVGSLRNIPAQPQWRRPRASWRLEVAGRNLLRYRDHIGFLLPYKRKRLPEGAASASRTEWDRIVSCEVVGAEVVYGFTVEPGHKYYGDGFLNHNSSKTDTALAEIVIRASGHIPNSLLETYPLEKMQGPIRGRVVCNGTKILGSVIKPKLQWDAWSGGGDPGTAVGHWGWVPRHCLIGGTWERAFSERYQTLHVSFCVLCTILPHRDQGCRGCAAAMPLDALGSGHTWPRKWAGGSRIECMTYDQDLSAFAGASLHVVVHDELPPPDRYRENRMRTMDVRGQVITAFTPPDIGGQAQVDAAWFHDHVYEPGLPGPSRHPDIETITLWTEHNTALPKAEIAAEEARLTEEQREVRLRGRFIHLSGVVFKTFTDEMTAWWCFRCVKRVTPSDGICLTCKGDDLVEFCHTIEPIEIPPNWPVVFVTDPHPRKPDAMGWFAVTPSDDCYLIANIEQEGTTDDVRRAVEAVEKPAAWRVCRRLMDPNIATESNDKLQRGWTIRSEYDRHGLRCDLANDEVRIGIENVEGLLRPDPATRRPRLRIFSTCHFARRALKRWSWGEWARPDETKEPKETVQERFKDHVDLIRYFANDRPTYSRYTTGTRPQRWGGRRR